MAQPVINPDTPLPSQTDLGGPGNDLTTLDGAVSPAGKKRRSAAGNAVRAVSSPWASLVAIIIAIAWTVPTLGLLVTSFRTQADIQTTGWWYTFAKPWFTMRNYDEAMFGSSTSLADYFVNSLVITIPAVTIPLLLASIASYAFAWIKFPGRDWLLIVVIVLLAVPVQVALIPIAKLYGSVGLFGSILGVIIFHTSFGLPFAIFLLRNFFTQIPVELLEASRIDGASEWRIFSRIILPLGMPAIASLSIFQFLWVWNDMLVALIFTNPSSQPVTVAIQSQLRQFGANIDVLSSGAFLSIIIPLIVFFAFQRYFVSALLAGSTK